MNEGIVERLSRFSVDETVDRLENALRVKEIKIFALVDHSGEAAKVGMTLAPTKLLIFGSPKAGTPLMQASANVALDLPLKILVRQDEEARTWIIYNSPQYLLARHNLPEELLTDIAAIESLVATVAE